MLNYINLNVKLVYSFNTCFFISQNINTLWFIDVAIFGVRWQLIGLFLKNLTASEYDSTDIKSSEESNGTKFEEAVLK